jgi:hypothetical protein
VKAVQGAVQHRGEEDGHAGEEDHAKVRAAAREQLAAGDYDWNAYDSFRKS